MKYRTEQQQILYLIALFTISIVLVNFIFEDNIYYTFALKNYLGIHLIFEFFIVFFCFVVAIQTWLGTLFNPDFKRALIGALFLAVGIIEGFHIISYSDMPFFIAEVSHNSSVWFSTIQRLLVPIGLIIIYSLADRAVSKKFCNAMFAFSLIGNLLICFTFYLQFIPFPQLFDEDNNATLVKQLFHILLFILAICAIIVVWKKRESISHNVHLIMFALFFLLLSELMYFMYERLFDVYIFSAHIFHLSCFALLFFAFYYSQVRNPFVQLVKAHKKLEKSQQTMKQIAYFDAETGLQNEQFLKEDLQRELQGNEMKALIVFNIDRFNHLKSTIGQAQSVILMKQISQRITAVLDDPTCFYKLDSDRFVIYLDKVENDKEIKRFAEKLQNVVKEPLSLSHSSLNVSFQFGAAIYPTDATTSEDLIQYAVFALYESERSKNTFTFFNAEMQKARENRMRFENDLKYALNGQLFLEYQPQLDFKTGEISSMEALIRWRHPEKGLISPFEFIPIAEESGLIVPIGNWVLETACRDTVALQQKLGKRIRVAVNLSIGQIYQEDLVDEVERILNKTGITPSDLQLEVTESMSDNVQQIIPVLQKLKALGVTIAMDDFGTGYSSLSYLKEFPIDVLKIDRSFVWSILDSEKDEALVRMIISIAKHLGLQVVAEGIENMAQLRYLNEHECDKIQGYYISKPITLEQLESKFSELQSFVDVQMKQLRVPR